jgi:uncharacterized membrane protein YfcA
VHLIVPSLAVAFSAWIQSSVGFGYALLSAPLLALVAPELVPGSVMVSAFVLAAATGYRERGHIDRRGVVLGITGRVPGSLVGAFALAGLPPQAMAMVFGGVVLLAIVMSVSGWRVSRAAPSLIATGVLSGVMGTLTSIGGPPFALVYQDADGPTLRATLNTYFALGNLTSIAALVLANRFGSAELVRGALLMPATLVGLALSNTTRRWIDRGRTRGAVLAVATLSALGVLLKAVFC